MASGTVKWYNATKGFGFVAPDTAGGDIFIHRSALERAGLTTLAEGQKIRYDLAESRNGKMSADAIELIDISADSK